MLNQLKNLRFPSLLVLLLLVITANAQIRIASPYSRFGLGDISGNNNAWNASMGKIGYGIRSPYHVNFDNPASYTAFDSCSFVFEGGFVSNFNTLKTSTQSDSRNYTSLGYLLFGVPVTKWWRSSIGLVPFSDVGYNVTTDQKSEEIGRIAKLYTGSGGINRVFWGNGFKIFKNFSLGVNASYLFGSINRESVAIFPDSIYFIDYKVDNYTYVSDLYFDFGAQYTIALKKNLKMTVGASFAANSKVHSHTDILSQSFFLGADGVEHPRDTITKYSGSFGNLVIPLITGFGFSFEKTDHWMAGADFRWQNWNKLSVSDQGDSLVNSFQVSAGAEFLPDINNYYNYIKRIRYRVGVFYEKSYLKLRGNDLNGYAFTLGFGLPLRGVKTALNIGFQLGTRGTTSAGLIQESYFKFIVGFSIYERWFLKRKYY
jgi:hypothetical protein